MRIVFESMMLAGFLNMLDGMHQVPVGDHGMVRGFLEFPGLMMLGGGPMMLGGVLEKLRRSQMVVNALL
jgi:hypothetical protein